LSNSDDKAEQEVRFWRRYIRWWEEHHGTPAPARMYEALAYAERRAGSLTRHAGYTDRTTIH
jgi:hypothetical protein